MVLCNEQEAILTDKQQHKFIAFCIDHNNGLTIGEMLYKLQVASDYVRFTRPRINNMNNKVNSCSC